LTWESISQDARFRVTIPAAAVDRMVATWATAPLKETGGIVIGHYSEDRHTATVTRLTGPPRDSKQSRFSFFRGTRGLHPLLKRLWRTSGEFYLGEWHVHPNGPAQPSAADIAQMRSVARSSRFECPEPLLCILGGTPERFHMRAWVFAAHEASWASIVEVVQSKGDRPQDRCGHG
jgi:integrative and conjugative element protein (TIGR02256 family)